MKKGNNRQALSWIYSRVKKYIPCFLLISVLAAAVSLSYVALALLSKWVLEIATDDAEGNILTVGIMLLILVVFQVLCSGVESILKSYSSAKLTVALREYLFTQITRKKYSDVSRYHSGDLVNRLTSDVEILQSGLVSLLPNVVSMLTKIIGCVAAIIALEPLVAVIVLALGILVPALGRLLSKKYKSLHKEVQQTDGVARSFMQECFENRAVIKTFKTQDYIFKRLSDYFQKNYKIKIKRSFISIFLHLGLYAFFTIGYYGVLVWGAFQIANPETAFTYGTLMAFLQLVSQLRLPLQNISGILPQYYSCLASAERLMEIEYIDNEKAALSENELNKCREDFKFLQAENISFAYDGDRVISGLSVKILRGSMTAFMGDSGAGKSTVFKLLLNLYEVEEGKITFNGDTLIDASNRGMFSYVPQGNMIISGTIKENITMLNPNVTDETVENAAKIAEIYDYVSGLPDGFNTELSERGSGLSEGQLQRIAIARAIACDSPILLLDEATTALDKPTEKKVLQNITSLSDKTVNLVTHRTSNLNLCDDIINLTE